METKHRKIEGDHAATVREIARAAGEGELTLERLGEILQNRHGAVNCYPGQPTSTCYPIAYFVALEGRMGRKMQIELARAEWESDRPGRWWDRRPWRDYDFPVDHVDPPFSVAYMLERLVRHMQGCCAGTTRHAFLITDTWNAPAFERWRANIEQIRKQASLEVYLIGEGNLCTRLW